MGGRGRLIPSYVCVHRYSCVHVCIQLAQTPKGLPTWVLRLLNFDIFYWGLFGSKNNPAVQLSIFCLRRFRLLRRACNLSRLEHLKSGKRKHQATCRSNPRVITTSRDSAAFCCRGLLFIFEDACMYACVYIWMYACMSRTRLHVAFQVRNISDISAVWSENCWT